MTYLSKFDLTAQNLTDRANPKGTTHGLLGTLDAETTAKLETTLAEQEAYVDSRVPPKYYRLFDHIDGEIVIGAPGARGTETQVQLSLYPCSNVVLYINYGGVWDERTWDNSVDESLYEVDEETGLVTFETGFLKRNDRLVATYDHAGMGRCLLLRKIILDLAAAEVFRQYNPANQTPQIQQEWAKQAYSDLARMERRDDGILRIAFLDDIDLIKETNSPNNMAQEYDPFGGML